MATFGYKMAWLALEGGLTPGDVAELLGLVDVHDTTWSDGVAAAYGERQEVLITSPLPGPDTREWTLVCGSDLFTVDVDLPGISRRLGGDAQWFGTHRVVESHGWTRARAGELVRRFWTVGDTGECVSVGEPDAFELSLGVPPPMDDEDALFDAVLEAGIDEDTVMRVAGRWSVDPQSLADVDALSAWVSLLPARR